MSKILKKLSVMMLCITMIVISVIGCGSNAGSTESEVKANEGTNSGNDGADTQEGAGDTEKIDVKDMVTLNFTLFSIYDFSDAAAVQEKLNEILAEKYQIQVKLTFINSGSWTQQTNLMLTSDEVDVLTLFKTPLSTYVSNGQLLPLDDYYENASDAFKSVWSEDEINGTRVNGSLYSITNLRNFANTYDVMMSKEIAEEMKIDPAGINSLEALDELLYKVKEAYPDLYAMVPQTGAKMSGGWTWDGLGDQSYIGVLADCGQTDKVENLLATDDFKDYCAYTHKWYQDGLIMADALSNTETGYQLVKNGKAFCYLSNNSNVVPAGITMANVIPAWTESNSYASISYGINAATKHPDESWKLMEAIYTDAEVATLLIDGIEGIHYVLNEDGTISYTEGYDVSTIPYGGADQYWSFPNAALSLPLQANGADFFEELTAFNQNSSISIASGFSFDSTSVTDEYSACINVMDKYYNALMCGTIDPETSIPMAISELEDAGISKIIEAKQEQLNAFLAGK